MLMETLITHLSPQACANRLQQLGDNRSFFPKTGKQSIHITFTRFQSQVAQDGRLRFRLNARGSTYRGIGILYVHLSGVLEARAGQTTIHYELQPGLPTSLFEQAFAVTWNLIIILSGITMITSAAGLPPAESIPRYAFLPVIYGIYGIRLSILYRRAAKAVPGILAQWCRPQI
jgi:hypothetical protein